MKEGILLDTVILLIKYTLLAFASLMQFAMLGRALLSWFDPAVEWGITAFLDSVTEPVIRPIRLLCQRMGWFEGFLLDIPFLITVILLSVLEFAVGMAL